jgi:hypothetical protein
MKNRQNLKLRDVHASSQEISKKYKRQSLGMPPRHPFFIGKNLVTFQDTIFLLLHALCVFLGASVVLVFFVSFVLFAAVSGWITSCLFWRETYFIFHCQERSSFHSYQKPSVLLFPLLLLVFVFRLDLCSDLDLSLHQGVFLPLIFIGFHQKRCL